jgi:hypothetical protein
VGEHGEDVWAWGEVDGRECVHMKTLVALDRL